MTYRFPVRAPEGWAGERPVVIGAGPCGLLAALILAQMGLKPIIIERGKAVRERTKDTWALWRRHQLVPESNVQFGEGGAGTFSDGKLYSRIKDPRHLSRKVLTEFVKAGAPEDILYAAHPHIGTFRLVTMVISLRETIEKLGGEYRFETRVEDFAIEDGRLVGLTLSDGSFCPRAMWCWRWAIPRAIRSRRCTRAAWRWRPSPLPSACGSSTRKAGSTRPATAPMRAARCWARRIMRCRTRLRTGGRCTVSACARAARWWRPPARKAAW
jgi:glycine/D-amino acid oxidase-like deaminating enzyme